MQPTFQTAFKYLYWYQIILNTEDAMISDYIIDEVINK